MAGHHRWLLTGSLFFHAPQLLPREMSPLKSLPSHPLPLLCLRGRFGLQNQNGKLKWSTIFKVENGLLSPRLRPPLPCCSCSTMSRCLWADLACMDQGIPSVKFPAFLGSIYTPEDPKFHFHTGLCCSCTWGGLAIF